MSLESYAHTSVSPGRTKEQIEKLLERVGAVGFRWDSGRPQQSDGNSVYDVLAHGYEQLTAGLRWNDREIAFRLRIEYLDEKKQRQNLRALYWYLKAKIEAIEFGIVDLEQEFLPYVLVSGDETVYDSLGGPNLRLLVAPEG